MEYRKGDTVKAKGRRGELLIMFRTADGAGYWAWSAKAGHMVPIRDGDIKGGA